MHEPAHRSFAQRLRDYAGARSQLIRQNVVATLPLLPELGRKPAVTRHWLFTARWAQIVLLLALLTLPALVPAAVEGVLEQIFPPRTSQQLFGLLNQTRSDPRVGQGRDIVTWLLWAGALGAALILLWRHIPGALVLAGQRARELETQADSLCGSDPARSARLYRSAAALVLDPAFEHALERKRAKVERGYDEEVDAVNRAAAAAGDAEAAKKTVELPGSGASGLPVPAVGADGRYELESEIGRGAMGVVYRARDVRLDRPVALKQLFSHGRNEPEILRRFRQEARVLARLAHPNIVQVYDFVEEDSGTWIAMELLQGEDLEWRLAAGALPVEESVRLGVELADALGYAHEQGVIHRDFKPANVFIDARERSKITDFGIAKLSESSMHTQVGTILGSPAYMSPEQARGEAVDARSDIYALGVTLFHMVTGRVPFMGDTRSVLAQVLTREPPAPAELNPAVTAELEALILRLLAKEPARRPAAMAEVKADLAGC